jgi:hypothetical protein
VVYTFYKIPELTYRCTTDVEQDKCDIPIIIGDTGILAQGLKKNLEAIPEKHSVDSLQKTAILGTSHTVCKLWQSET